MLASVLGIVASVGLTLFYIPQIVAVHNSPELKGFYLPAWVALLVAVTALTIQAGILGIWTAVSANTPAVLGTSYIITQIFRKGVPHDG